MLDRKLPDSVCDHCKRVVVVGVDLADRYVRLGCVDRNRGWDLLGDVAMDEDVAWRRGSDDAFGDAGV